MAACGAKARRTQWLPFSAFRAGLLATPSIATLENSDTQVNPHTEQWVTGRFAELGYTADVAASRRLRSAAQFPWFKSNIFVMRRNVSLTSTRRPGERERQSARGELARRSVTNYSALFQQAMSRPILEALSTSITDLSLSEVLKCGAARVRLLSPLSNRTCSSFRTAWTAIDVLTKRS